jgi:hypothetical protein
MSQSSASSSSKWNKFKRIIKTMLLVMLVFFAIAPVILSAIPGAESNQTYSVYNTSYDGYSVVRQDLESIQVGNADKYGVTNLISNLNALNRFNGSGVLVIAGPAANFDTTETIALILYLLRGGSVIIADDFGSGNDILDPIFDAFENVAEFADKADEFGFDVPNVDQIFAQDSGADITDPNTSTDPSSFLSGGTDAAASEIGTSFFTDLIGKVIKRFAFNHTGVLMDLNNNKNPNRPIITEIDKTDMSFGNDKFSYTEGVSKIQMEFATIISVKVATTDENGNEVDRWQPLQKLSTSLLTGSADEGLELSLPFFPLYSSKNSWIETDMKAAGDGTAEPDPDEWGNAKFALGLTIPLFPGFGKLIFLSDPSMFINRWTVDVQNNDNLLLFRNLIDMATYTQEVGFDVKTGESIPIPVIFDFGHTYQGLLSPALYSTALMKLIAQMSMFPFYAPFVPLAAYGYGKRLLPEKRRLRPILLTKRRGEKGHSDFERKLEDIKVSGGYGEPIMHLSRRLVRQVQGDVRFEGTLAKNPRELSKFFNDNWDHLGSRRELESQLKAIFKIAANPTRRMNLITAKKYLTILKRLIELVD